MRSGVAFEKFSRRWFCPPSAGTKSRPGTNATCRAIARWSSAIPSSAVGPVTHRKIRPSGRVQVKPGGISARSTVSITSNRSPYARWSKLEVCRSVACFRINSGAKTWADATTQPSPRRGSGSGLNATADLTQSGVSNTFLLRQFNATPATTDGGLSGSPSLRIFSERLTKTIICA